MRACSLVASPHPQTPKVLFIYALTLIPSAARCNRLVQLREVIGTLVFYAPPHRLVAILTDMVAVFGGHRRVCIVRELTKMHEDFFR